MGVKLTNAALDLFKRADTGAETIIIRGVVDSASLISVKTDAYQREIVSTSKIEMLAEALEKSSVPDIELGMRGHRTRETTEEGSGTIFHLLDDVYVIDGLQRTTAAMHLMQKKPGSMPRIGAVVHLDTNFDWERERFRILNQERSKLSVNILLRNLCPDFESVDMLKKLCDDSAFVLHDRVCWAQNMLRSQIITALTLVRTVGILHSRFGGARSSNVRELPASLDRIMVKVGRTTMRDNVKTFYGLIDDCWGVRRIVFVHGAMHMRVTFLSTLTDILTRHEDFWRENKLFIDRDLRQKIAKFPMTDPVVQQLAGAGGKAREMLYQMMLDHINSGRRTRRLKSTSGFEPKAEAPSITEVAGEEVNEEEEVTGK